MTQPKNTVTPALPAPPTGSQGVEKEADVIDIGVLLHRARFYLNLKIEGQGVRFYGTRRSLAKQLTAIGCALDATEIVEGRRLDVRCRARTYLASGLLIVQYLLPLTNNQEE